MMKSADVTEEAATDYRGLGRCRSVVLLLSDLEFSEAVVETAEEPEVQDLVQEPTAPLAEEEVEEQMQL